MNTKIEFLRELIEIMNLHLIVLLFTIFGVL